MRAPRAGRRGERDHVRSAARALTRRGVRVTSLRHKTMPIRHER